MHGAAIPSPDGDRRAVRLSTPRLRLAPVAADDLEELFALHADPAAFRGDTTPPLTDRAQMRWVLGQWRAVWAREGRGYLTVRAADGGAVGRTADGGAAGCPGGGTGEPPTGPGGGAGGLPPGLLGVVGVSPLATDDGPVLSAYWRIAPAVQGRGVATEAMRAVLAAPRLRPRGVEVVAVTARGNEASCALADRLGFRPAAATRTVPGGRDGDLLLVLPPEDAP